MKRASGSVEGAILGGREVRQVLTLSLVPEQPGGKQSRRQAGEVRQRTEGGGGLYLLTVKAG